MSPPPKVALLAALACAVVAACRKPSGARQPPSEPRGVGWTMPQDSAVSRGVLLSSPAGREDALVPVVAAAANGWAAACAGERAGAARAAFSIQLPEPAGAPTAPTEGGTSYERCLAARAAATLAAAKDVPRGIGLDVTLDLR